LGGVLQMDLGNWITQKRRGRARRHDRAGNEHKPRVTKS